MAINVDAAFSRGDVMRRLADVEAKLSAMSTARRLESAAIGRGGLRIQGGRLTIQDIGGDDMLRAGGDPGEFFLRQDLLTPLALAGARGPAAHRGDGDHRAAGVHHQHQLH